MWLCLKASARGGAAAPQPNEVRLTDALGHPWKSFHDFAEPPDYRQEETFLKFPYEKLTKRLKLLQLLFSLFIMLKNE